MLISVLPFRVLKTRMPLDCLHRYLHEAGSCMQIMYVMPCVFFCIALFLLAFMKGFMKDNDRDLHYVN